MWTKSACVLLAWSLVLIVTAAGLDEPARPAQADNRNANSTKQITVPSALAAVTPSMTTARTAAKETDNKKPDTTRTDITKTVRYVVRPGDTLSGVAARFWLPGGWQALYAANRTVIGPDPDVIRTGTVLTIPGRAPAMTPAQPAAHRERRPHQPPSVDRTYAPATVRGQAPAATGMPAWLTVLLLAMGVFIGGAFLLHLAMAAGRGRRKPAEGRPGIFLADHDQLIVTRSRADDTIYVLRPPGADPAAILRVARLVLAEDSYRELAEYLGLPASWPIIMADYHRLVVAHSTADDIVCVLRPPGEDPTAVLRAARLVLREEPYEELASQLGVPASWPLE